MEGSIEKRTGESSLKDKLSKLKSSINEYGGFLSDDTVNYLNESISMAEKVVYVEGMLRELIDFLDVDLDVMDELDHVLEVLNVLKNTAIWLKDSTAGEYVVRAAAEVVALVSEFEAAADKLKSVGIESKEGKEIAQEMKIILGKIITQLKAAIEAIEFVKLLNGTEMNWEGIKKVMEFIDNKK